MKLLLRSILFFALASFAPGAFGQSVWNGSVDDNWATSGNWTPSGEPSATTNALINIAATINLPGTATSVGNLNITTSTVGLTASTSTFTDTLLTVNAGGTLNLIIPTGGTVSSSNTAFVSKIGDGSGTGTLNLTGTGTLSFPSGTNNTEDGIGGTGIINQSIDGSSTTVNVNATLRIGADGNVLSPPSIPAGSTAAAGGTGTYNLGGTAILNATTIDVGVGSGTGGGTTTGGSTPTVGTLNITSTSATALTAFAVNIGTDESATGATIANTTGLVNQSAGTATMTILRVGLAPGTGVSGAYNLSGTGILNDLNTISIGSNLGASGSFQQSAGTTVTTPFLFVGEKGMGNYALQGGTLTVNSNLNIGETAGANGILTQSAGSTLIANGTFDIGTGGTGDFKYNGGTLTLSSGIAIGANGTFDQNSSITLTNPATQAVTIAAGGSYNLNAGTLTTGGTTFFTGAGNFNFAGGTVLVSSPWLDSLNGTISGTSTINTAGNPVGLSGNLTGTGTLDFIGGGFIDLSGTNNGVDTTWGAQINGVGTTLIADTGVANLSALGSFVIGAGATLNVASSGNPTDTFAGSISGAGNFITGQNDTAANKLILSGTTNLTGASTTTIGAGGFGTLEVDNGTISNVNGSAGDPTDTFDVGSGTSTGTVTLLGTNSLGRITVHTGSTLLAGNVSGDIANTGTLGTLGTPNAPATLSITGRLLSNGTLLVNENGITADEFGSGLLTIAKLSGIVKVVGFGTITNVVIVDTTGGVTIGGNGNLNDPAGLTTNPPTALFSSTLSENGADTQLLLSTVQNTLGGFAQTPNEASVARPLDSIIMRGSPLPAAFGPLLGAFNQLPASQIPGALEELTPENLQYARMISFENSTFLAERMNGVDADLRGGYGGLDTSAISVVSPGFNSGLGRSLGTLLAYNDPAYHQAAPNGVNYYPGGGDTSGGASSPSSSSSSSSSTQSWDSSSQVISDSPNPYMAAQHPSGPEAPVMNEFIGGDAVLADLNRNQSAAYAPSSKASYTAGDAAAGVSFRLTPHLAAGVLFDYNHTDAKTDSSGSKTHVDSYSPGLFATYFDHGFYANGLFSFGYNNYSNSRDISFLGETANSRPTGQQYVGDLDFGYDFHPDKNWVVGPTLGATYTHLNIDSFTETGAPGADLAVNTQSADSLRSRLGGHIIFQTNTGDVLLQPNLTAMWQHEYLDSSSGITSSFNDFSSSPFTIQTAAPSRDSALVGCGVTATLNNSMALYLNYLADVGAGDYFAQSVIGGFKARF